MIQIVRLLRNNRKRSPRERFARAVRRLLCVLRMRRSRANTPTRQGNRRRCFFPGCRRRLRGFNAFECRCLYQFCEHHRLPTEHSCTFDFTHRQALRIAAQNERVRARKVDRI